MRGIRKLQIKKRRYSTERIGDEIRKENTGYFPIQKVLSFGAQMSTKSGM